MSLPGVRRVHRHRFATRNDQPAWVAQLSARLNRWRGVRARPLFQWNGFYARGRCFAALPRTIRTLDLLLRINPVTRAALLRSGRGRPYVRASRTQWVRIRVGQRGPAPWVLKLLRQARAEA